MNQADALHGNTMSTAEISLTKAAFVAEMQLNSVSCCTTVLAFNSKL